MDWDNKDNYMKEVTLICWEAYQTLTCYYHFQYLLVSFYSDLDKINLATGFFAETLKAMRYRLILGTSKLFEKNKDSANILKLLNCGEQNHIHRDNLRDIIKKARIEYNGFESEIEELFDYRDKLFAHQDRKGLLNTDTESILDSDLWDKIEEMLNWALSILQEISVACGDHPRTFKKPANDLSELLSRIV